MNRKKLGLVLLASLAISPAAIAEQTGFYVAADFGSTSVDLNKSALDNLFAWETDNYLEDISSSLDDSDTSWNVAVGYRFIPYLAVEGAYVDLGGAEYKATSIYDEAAKVDVESSGFAASVLGILPFAEKFEVFARLGLYFGDTEASGTITYYDGETLSASDSESEQEMFWGIGAGFAFNKNWAVRAEYMQYMDIGEDDLTAGEADVDRISVGIKYAF